MIERLRSVKSTCHGGDIRRVPLRDVRIARKLAFKEATKVGDQARVPSGDVAVSRSGGGRVGAPRVDGGLELSFVCRVEVKIGSLATSRRCVSA